MRLKLTLRESKWAVGSIGMMLVILAAAFFFTSGPDAATVHNSRLLGAWSSRYRIALPSEDGEIEAYAQTISVAATETSSDRQIRAITIPSKHLCWVGLDIPDTMYFLWRNQIVAVDGWFNDTICFYPSRETSVKEALNDRMQKMDSENLQYPPLVVDLVNYLPKLKNAPREPDASPLPASLRQFVIGPGRFSVEIVGQKQENFEFTGSLAPKRIWLDGKLKYVRPWYWL
jgi:hypothetical protein